MITTMTLTAIKVALTEQQALGLTAAAEARGDRRQGNSSIEERIAVMLVCRNRVAKYKRFNLIEPSYKAVCLARKQFSCWNDDPKDANHQWLLDQARKEIAGNLVDPLVEETLWLAGGVIAGTVLDTLKGADHYYAPQGMIPPGRIPDWAIGKTPTAEVGKQIFFTLY